ncbi:hypothetical protein Tco_1017543 [Tanacetum coccineum]|uniref:Uncharacterized protein n=1 Tax=Tanacetum coccineum TaxID=301880 RepID=A0ABQ5FT64_9ASTR
MCSGFSPARDTCTFPESDPVWSSCMGSGSGPARDSCASVPLSVRSESVVDEDSWTTFSDVSSDLSNHEIDQALGNELLVLQLQ